MAAKTPNYALLKAVEKTDISVVRELIEKQGADPNAMVTVGEPPYDSDYHIYSVALNVQRDFYEKLARKIPKAKKEQIAEQRNLHHEIIEYLTPKITNYVPDGKTVLWHLFVRGSLDCGFYDAFILDLMKIGFDLKAGGIYSDIGKFSIDVVKKIFDQIGIDNGESVGSAIYNKNFELMDYLLELNLPVNTKLVYIANGGFDYPLHLLLLKVNWERNYDWAIDQAIDRLKKLLALGADKNLKNSEQQTAIDVLNKVAKFEKVPDAVWELLNN